MMGDYQPKWPGVTKEPCQYGGCKQKVRVFVGLPTPKYCPRHALVARDQLYAGRSKPRICAVCNRPGHLHGHCPEGRK